MRFHDAAACSGGEGGSAAVPSRKGEGLLEKQIPYKRDLDGNVIERVFNTWPEREGVIDTRQRRQQLTGVGERLIRHLAW